MMCCQGTTRRALRYTVGSAKGDHVKQARRNDFVNIRRVSTDFEPSSKPIRPHEQLMSVLPAASKQ